MHSINESVTSTMNRAITRRTMLVLAGSSAATALLIASGCSFLGIEDPNKNKDDEETLPQGAVDFERLIVALDLNTDNWEWTQLDNPSSHLNGSIIVGVPISAQNNDEITRVLNYVYVKVLSPAGDAQADLSPFYADDILQHGSIYPDDLAQGILHVLYSGPGTYTIQFDNLLGDKAQLDFEIDGSDIDMRSIPPSNLAEADVAASIPAGVQFEVAGLTLEFSTDENSYVWDQTWDENNEDWYGRWCVGVPMWISNNTDVPLSFTIDMYGLFDPDLMRVEDPAPWFAGASAGYVGELQPGDVVETLLIWPYTYDGQYFAAFDNNGSPVIASVNIAQ